VRNQGNDFSDKDGHSGLNHDRPETLLAILTGGTTVINGNSGDGTEYIFAGTSVSNMPTLQFVGAIGVTDTYSENGFLAAIVHPCASASLH
jgi:hypothetical protein